MSLAHVSELRVFDVYLQTVKRRKKVWIERKKISKGVCPWIAFAWNLFRVFLKNKKKKEGLWGKFFIGNNVLQYFVAPIFPPV